MVVWTARGRLRIRSEHPSAVRTMLLLDGSRGANLSPSSKFVTQTIPDSR